MAKRHRGKVRRYARRVRHRVSKMRVPFEVPIALASIPFTTPAEGWGVTPYQAAQQGDIGGIMAELNKGFLGMNQDGSVDVFSAVNPFNFGNARYSKMLLWAGLIGSFRRKLSGKYTDPLIRRIPMIGRILG